MISAHRALPGFIATVSEREPRSLPESPFDAQIYTILHRLESRSSSGFPTHETRFNRTLLMFQLN